MRPYKRRTVPYKLLYYNLYGQQNWILRGEKREVTLETGPCTRALRISNSRFWEALEYLKATGTVIEAVQTRRGYCSVTYKEPLGSE